MEAGGRLLELVHQLGDIEGLRRPADVSRAFPAPQAGQGACRRSAAAAWAVLTMEDMLTATLFSGKDGRSATPRRRPNLKVRARAYRGTNQPCTRGVRKFLVFNYATLKKWDIVYCIFDILWGGILFVIGYTIVKMLM